MAALNPLEVFTKVPRLRPTMNIGCLFDIPTGVYHKGKHGESILSGGHSHITGLCGRGNTYKSTVAHHQNLSILDRYDSVDYDLVYDTENSLTPVRIDSLTQNFERLKDHDLDAEGRVIITDTSMMGNKWWEGIKALAKSKEKEGKKLKRTTPFLDLDGNYITMMQPTLVEIDSMSQMPFDSVELMQDKAEVGEAGRNMEAMKASAAKSQMIGEMPNLTPESGLYITMTAHLDDEIQLDPYAPPTKRLAFMKQKTIFKRVPKNFSFLTNNLYACSATTVLQNRSDKTTLFPRSQDDRIVGDTDLQQITIECYRSKNGISGGAFELAVSQTEGVLVGLSEFLYIKTRKFGISGNDRNYHLDLVPDIDLSRTTVRSKIDQNPHLKRGLEISSILCQIRHTWKNQPAEHLITCQELYDRVKANGYDWDTILNDTREYWVFLEDEKNHPKKFLSTMDLINMARPKDDPQYYHPYWWDDHMKKKAKANA